MTAPARRVARAALRFSARALVGGLLLAAGCARDVAVGHEDALAVAGEAAVMTPPLGLGGAATQAGGDGGASEPGGSNDPGALLWSADHETGSLEQWLGDGNGVQNEERSGQLELVTQPSHSGGYALSATISTGDGELHQAMIGRNITLREGRYGAWYWLPQAPRADYWVIMKLSNGADVDRFDIDIEAREGEPAHLRLYEHPDIWLTEPAALEFPIARWVHVEALYRSSPDADGRLIVLQDGQTVFDTGPRVTAKSELVTFFCGNTSRFVTPSPYQLFIDDATIHAAVLP